MRTMVNLLGKLVSGKAALNASRNVINDCGGGARIKNGQPVKNALFPP